MFNFKNLIIGCFAVSFLSLGTASVYADVEGDYDYTITNGAATINSYTGTETDLVIPSTLGGAPVEGIGNQGFYNKKFDSITLPHTMKTIGRDAFALSFVKSLTLNEGLVTIDDYAFNRHELNEINIPESVKSIGRNSFDYGVSRVLVFNIYSPDVVYNTRMLSIMHYSNTTIYGIEGSTTETYAAAQGLTFLPLQEPAGNSDASIDATVQVLPGTLTFANELVSVFADSVSLNGLSQTITAFFSDTIDVIDARGSHDGYDVQVGMSDLVSGSDVIGKENITFKNLSTISADGLVGSAIDQSGSSSFSLINFGAGQGIGQHVLDFSQAEMDIYLSEKTKAGLYTGAVTMSLVASP